MQWKIKHDPPFYLTRLNGVENMHVYNVLLVSCAHAQEFHQIIPVELDRALVATALFVRFAHKLILYTAKYYRETEIQN